MPLVVQQHLYPGLVPFLAPADPGRADVAGDEVFKGHLLCSRREGDAFGNHLRLVQPVL